MSTHKYIYVRKDFAFERDGKQFVNIHYLIGYCPQSITEYKAMLAEIQKDFPDADESEVGCHQVTKSDCVKGFTLLTYSAYIDLKLLPKLKKKGWYIVESGRCDYYW